MFRSQTRRLLSSAASSRVNFHPTFSGVSVLRRTCRSYQEQHCRTAITNPSSRFTNLLHFRASFPIWRTLRYRCTVRTLYLYRTAWNDSPTPIPIGRIVSRSAHRLYVRLLNQLTCQSQRVETPVTSRQSHCRRQRPHEPLFIGQTNLAPFTYHVGTRPRATAMDGSFASEASSVKTITRIPRNRHSRGKRRIPVPQKLLYETPAPLSRKGKERAKAPLTPRLAPPTPTGLPHTMSIRNTTSATNMATPTCHHHSTPFVARSAHLNHSFGSANSALSNRASLRRSDPQYIWAPTPLPHVTDGFYGFPHPLQSHEEPFDIPWTPKPMSIDPRSADVQQPSWPRALAHSETVCAHSPTQRTIHEAIPEMFHLSSPSINPKSLIKNASPVPDRTRGFTFALPARSSVELPMAKACHNFLLARRIQASKRRKLLREHQKHLAERFDRPAQVSPMNIDSHPLHLSPPPPQDAPCFAGFRPISSLAQVDETRPPHKRRREESPGSSHLLPTAQIIQIERRDDEADFSTTLRSALDRPTFEAEDREQRRAAWLEAEQRRMASALFVRRGRTRVQREQSRMR